MDDIAIKVVGVNKTFKLPHEKQSSLKGAFINLFKGGKRSFEKQQALKDITFEIKKGDFFGIVGRNGSGKSTLLKLLAGIYSPDSGIININGKLTPFIELGVGFNPELTGRENVYLNSALLGFNRKEVSAMYDDIVAFAEIERFMDQKLKNYSSGMQVRLAFSIAIQAKSDILVLDEVLAVGDEAFQQKCIDVFENYKSEKQTIVLVTHSMDTVRRFCNKAMLIDDGVAVDFGDPNIIAGKYSRLNAQLVESNLEGDNNELKESAIKLAILGENGSRKEAFNVGDEMKVRVNWPKNVDGVKNVGVAIIKNSGEFVFGTNTFDTKINLSENNAEYRVKLDIGSGKYHLMAGLFGETKHDVIEFLDYGPQFIIRLDPEAIDQGIARLKNEWVTNAKKT
jgi:ABC-2 type transport system ATP-binding protein